MLSKVSSYGLTGINGYPVQVEVDISNGMPAYDIVGLPGTAVREAKERVRSAIKNSGLSFPVMRITVNLAPADIKKESSMYDLPMALGILAATRQVFPESLEGKTFFGELSLNGDVRPVHGVLPMVIAAREQGETRFLLPAGNALEAAYVEGIEVVPANNIKEVVAWLNGEGDITPQPLLRWSAVDCAEFGYVDFSYVKGQRSAKRALEIAAAGGHNILLLGPAGSGKTMLAKSVPGILPEITFEEALEVTKIHSVAGALASETGIISERPFRAPHHNISVPALTGGGSFARPGEISLSHCGVLFLDELPEFPRPALEALRQPLEDGVITVARVNGSTTYPSDFTLVAAMNPCPCGNYGSSDKECRCSPIQIQRYLNKISGPLLDRIDLHIEMGGVTYGEISSERAEESSDSVRARVNAAREVQKQRYLETDTYCNAQLSNSMMDKHCRLDKAAKDLMKQSYERMGLSARAHTRILKVARTIADLEGGVDINISHLAEAIQYRSLDKKYWK